MVLRAAHNAFDSRRARQYDHEMNLEYAHFTDSHCGSCICRNPCDGFRESHMSGRRGHS
jgi:hypothetical protein